MLASPSVSFLATPWASHAGVALGVNFTLALTLVAVDARESKELKVSPVLSTWRFSYG